MSMNIEHCIYHILLYSLSKNLTTARVLGVQCIYIIYFIVYNINLLFFEIVYS